MSAMNARCGLMATVCLTTILSACSHDAVGPDSSNPLTQQQAMQVGTRLSREIALSLSSLTLGGSGGIAAASLRMSARTAQASGNAGAPCPALDNTTDADHDGIPDDATLTFAPPQCRSIADGDTTEVTGNAHIVDPVFSPPPDPQAFGYRVSFANLIVHFGAMHPDSSFTETRNGTDALLVSQQGLAQEHGFDIVHQDRDGSAHVVDQWHATFSPAAGMALIVGLPLPHGWFAAEGHTSWQRGNAAQQFEIATARPLEYDPDCTESAANRIRSGELHANIVGPGQQAFVRIVFADCGATIITVEHNQP